MRKLLIILLFLLGGTDFAMSQMRYAFVDTEYILSNIPEYETAKEQLDKFSKIWEEEISAQQAVVDKMYKEFKVDKVFLSPAMKEKREKEIARVEFEVGKLEEKYFGKGGELAKKREQLVKPILDDVFDAIKEIAKSGNYGAIFDRSQGVNVVYLAPKLDKSDKVLERLGYKKKRK
eukprot:Anaeramoba_ignava/a500285_10.p1 GENE.a500285_10~~a500285_10.p1  ORF type:complete len:176 (-),score=21.08 a500285_10:639-1166(-)